MNDTTKNLRLPLPNPGNTLDQDVYTLRQALGIIDRELFRTMQANDLLQDDGLGLYVTLQHVLAVTAKTELRMARLELEFLKLLPGTGGSGGEGSGGNTGGPSYTPEGAYVGPVVVSTSILDLKEAGVLFLLPDEGASEESSPQ